MGIVAALEEGFAVRTMDDLVLFLLNQREPSSDRIADVLLLWEKRLGTPEQFDFLQSLNLIDNVALIGPSAKLACILCSRIWRAVRGE